MTHIWGFTSDQHFGHRAVLAFCDRPFADLEAMREALIANYNVVVPEDATVIHVGDVFMRAKEDEARAILARLNGHKILVRGNHDGSFGRCNRFGFEVVTEELQMRIGGVQVKVNHFPYARTPHGALGRVDDRFLARRPTKERSKVLVHGHTHDSEKRNGSMIHVGVDAWDYFPVPLAEVEKLVEEVYR